mgnify:CR=1 FL=1
MRRARFAKMQKSIPQIADVRGLGAMTAIEFARDGEPAADIANNLKAEAAKRGLLLLTCGSYGNVMRIMVPLTIPDAVLAEGLDILEAALRAVLA